MTPVSPKVSSGSYAAGASGSLSVLVIWIIGMFGVAIPPEIAGAISALVAAGTSWLGGYLQHEFAPPNGAPQ